MGGALPPALLCAALGLALAFAGWRTAAATVLVLAVSAAASSLAPWPETWSAALMLAVWLAVIALGMSVHLRDRRLTPLCLGAGAAVGALTGAAVAVAGAPLDLAVALPCVLLFLPGRLLVQRRLGVAVKVAASWLIAVALLAGALSTVPTPGYEPDHME